MKQEIREPKASKVLGILSICLFFTTWPAMVLAIVGLSIKKSVQHRTRDITLNVIGLVMSTLWTYYVIKTMFMVGKVLSGY